MSDLKSCIKQYREIDDEIRELNRQVFKKRDDRKSIELEIADIIKDPKYNAIKKIKLEEDGSTISFKRPNEWVKPWSISQKDLKELVTQYFTKGGPANPDDLVKYIIETKKQTLVATEFSFTRTVPGEQDE
jgi:phage pi2 protein 07